VAAKGGTFASIDVGTTKICTLVAEIAGEGEMRILGVGVAPAAGISRGMVDNIRDASESIRASVEKAERSSATRILSAHVGIGGSHIQSLNNRGIVAIPERQRPITGDDVSRALDGARVVSLPARSCTSSPATTWWTARTTSATPWACTASAWTWRRTSSRAR